jgi:peptidoglycan hydrolase-like protein with peptidoglycan-binding domain
MAQPLLEEGSAGPAVRRIQQALSDLGYEPGALDGKFGARTKAAVRAYQRSWGLLDDGILWRAARPAPADLTRVSPTRGGGEGGISRGSPRPADRSEPTGQRHAPPSASTECDRRRAERDRHLVPNGFLGPTTWGAIEQLLDFGE